MDEKETMSMGEEKQTRSIVDPRPTDLAVFFAMIPGVLASYAAKTVDTRSANASAFQCVREALGQCAAMGLLRVGTQCIDGSWLALMPQNPGAVAGVQGATQQYPNQPGMGMPGAGGVVSQHPTYGTQPGPYGQASQGGGNKGVMVAMFPNGAPPPQL